MIDAKLNEYTKDEWFDVCRSLNPFLTREAFEAMWDEFLAARSRHELH